MAKSIEQQILELEKKKQELIEKREKQKSKGLKYVLIRTYSAGVFTGFLFNKKEKEVILKNARRLWFWEGAASLSELAMKGTSKPDKCKFPIAVDEVLLTEVIEILNVTPQAKKSIESVMEWKQSA